MKNLWFLLGILGNLIFEGEAILFPQKNEIRQYDQLNGLWTFVREPKNSYGVGQENKWHLLDLEDFKNATVMPVPSAYNDLIPDIAVRDHVGWVWYQYKFYASPKDRDYRTFLRFSSVNYYAEVFFNDHLIGDHVGGHLPFQLEVSLNFEGINKITVAVNNSLSLNTIPPGFFRYPKNTFSSGVEQYPKGYVEDSPNFDFFNYAGILRSVYLLKLPKSYIKELKIGAYGNGNFSYRIEVDTNESSNFDASVVVTSLKSKQRVYEGKGLQVDVKIPNVDQWNPRGFGQPNLHELEIKLINGQTSEIVDIYREKFGFRTVQVTSDSIVINGQTFYCKGFGMHEDFEIHGRGFNPVVMTKDLNMVEWMGGNCYRTSHYPYAEERAYEADRRGIAVITEVPAVGLSGGYDFTNEANQKLHAKMITEMIMRDRNHPSVIAWSLSNEPATDSTHARPYYSDLITLTHSLDSTRPVTIVMDTSSDNDKVADLLDFICFNRYYGWYANTGYLETIARSYIGEVLSWKKKFGKPIIITEYGADAIAGLLAEPGVDFTEQYQVAVLKEAHKAFDWLRNNGSLAGEMVWNFADFMTAQSYNRVDGNKKGMLTRTRQPKMAAYFLKERYETPEYSYSKEEKPNNMCDF